MAEAQFTPEVARGLVGVAVNPEAPITGTTNADLILKEVAARQSAGQSEEALKVIAREALPHKKQDVERVILWNLSSERDPTSQAKITPTNTNERRRVNETKKADEAIRSLVEQGTIDSGFRDQITAFLETNCPVTRDIIQAMRAAGGDVNTYVEGLMKTPGFKKFAMEFHTSRIDPSKRLTQEATINNLELSIANLAAQLGIEVTQPQIDAARSDLDIAETNLESHPAELLQFRTKSTRYQKLTNGMSETESLLAKHEGLGKQFEQQRSDLLTERKGLDATKDAAKIAQIDVDIKKIESKVDYANYTESKNKIAEHTLLESEISTLQTMLGPLQKEVVRKQEFLNTLLEKQKTNIIPQKKAEIEAQINQKKGELADARTLLEAEQMKFYRDATHIGEDAMEKYLNETFNNLKTMWKEEATKQAAKDTTEEGKLAGLAIDKAQKKLCQTSITKDGLTFYKPDKNKAKTLLNEAFKAGGAENVAVYLETQTNTALGLTVAEHAALKEKLKDPEFRKAQSEGLAKQALADYLIAGGRLNGDLVKSLATTDFGNALLTDARAKADTAIQQYKDKFGKGVLDKSTRFGEFLKGNWWKFGIGIIALLILLGIITAAK